MTVLPGISQTSTTHRWRNAGYKRASKRASTPLKNSQSININVREYAESLTLGMTCNLNLESSAGSRKSTQALGAPGKTEKALITSKVATRFSVSPCTPISYVSFPRPTEDSRLNDPYSPKRSKQHVVYYLNPLLHCTRCHNWSSGFRYKILAAGRTPSPAKCKIAVCSSILPTETQTVVNLC